MPRKSIQQTMLIVAVLAFILGLTFTNPTQINEFTISFISNHFNSIAITVLLVSFIYFYFQIRLNNERKNNQIESLEWEFDRSRLYNQVADLKLENKNLKKKLRKCKK